MPKEMKFRIDDAQFTPWPTNFEGRPTLFKDAGHRSFSVIIEPRETADQMAIDGWPVKCQLPTEERPDTFCFIEVIVKYVKRDGTKAKPPKIVLISSKGERMINEDNVAELDNLTFSNVDLIATSYEYNVNGKSGITAYLKTMYLTLDEDDLDRKYAKKKPEKTDA